MRGCVLPADSLPTTKVRGFGRWAGGDSRAFLAVARKPLREARGEAMAVDKRVYNKYRVCECGCLYYSVGIQNRKCTLGIRDAGILQVEVMSGPELVGTGEGIKTRYLAQASTAPVLWSPWPPSSCLVASFDAACSPSRTQPQPGHRVRNDRAKVQLSKRGLYLRVLHVVGADTGAGIRGAQTVGLAQVSGRIRCCPLMLLSSPKSADPTRSDKAPPDRHAAGWEGQVPGRSGLVGRSLNQHLSPPSHPIPRLGSGVATSEPAPALHEA